MRHACCASVALGLLALLLYLLGLVIGMGWNDVEAMDCAFGLGHYTAGVGVALAFG